MEEQNYRGKCYSTTGKKTKTGDLKMAGNFSYLTFHQQQLQSKDYYVRKVTYESGIEQLIAGEQTPLAQVMGEQIATLALRDPHFELYMQGGKKKIGAREYDMRVTLRRNLCVSRWSFDPHLFTLRVEIYTDGEVQYTFPEY